MGGTHRMSTFRRRLISAAITLGLVAGSVLVPAAANAASSSPVADGPIYIRFECGASATMVLSFSLKDGSGGSGSGDAQLYAHHFQERQQEASSVKTFHYPGEYTWEVPLTYFDDVIWQLGVTGGAAFTDAYFALLPEDCWSPFQDVPYNASFYKEIRWMAETGISTGYPLPPSTGENDPYSPYLPRQEYRPFGSVTRDAMAAFLYRFAGSPEVSVDGPSPFVDVPKSHPFYKQILWLKNSGVSTGWPSGNGREYRPASPITRAAMAAFLERMLGDALPPESTPATSPFTDVATDGPFYDAISWLSQKGISTGWPAAGGKKEFRPYENITRDAMAAFLYRTAGLFQNQSRRSVSGGAEFTAPIASLPLGADIAGLSEAAEVRPGR